MFLACDIGNTNTKWGLFENDRLKDLLIIPNEKFDLSFLNGKKINSVAISSVVPDLTKQIYFHLQNNFSITPFLITKDSKFNLIIDYETPETLGIDRVCSAEGALYLFKKETKNKNNEYFLVSIDFGTATTINIVNNENKFSGGIIAPGIETMFSSLHKETAQLPKVTADDYKYIIGKSTISSIASDVINSQLGLIESVLNNLKQNSTYEVYLYITGGNAKKIIPHLTHEFIYAEELVILGVKSIYERNLIE